MGLGVRRRLEKSVGPDRKGLVAWVKEFAFSYIQGQRKTGSIYALKNKILESRKGWLDKAWAGRERRGWTGGRRSVAASEGGPGWLGTRGAREAYFYCKCFCQIYACAFLSMCIYFL